ncbi:MAG TPA: hypothetical protein PKN57_03670 [Saprospiraceae bacterium]|nr:hypothetical protein [Saprospiraceae bacterium]MCC6687557.1 hypothetical protein [Saprospiraceae bacterium]HMV23776.1 hypothetical protein [Saprospiraceae bacterium]HMW75145.1 hypothetical protein [Saprospiraceae bacterium]HMX82222.1 hypothetical protein [Saprospiraceae bacterium]
MSAQNDNRNKILGIAIAAIIALLGVNAYLLYNKSKLTTANTQLSTQLDETSKLKLELEQQYNESLSKLEEMRGDNEEMNAMIDKQKSDLQAQKNQISNLLKNKGDLSKAKEQIAQLISQRDQFMAQLEELKMKNEQLTADNTKLTTDLQSEKANTESLTAAKAALVSEKDNLASQNEKLSSKVTRASVIPVSKVEITGLKVDSKNKEHKKRYAKNIDRLRVCFDAAANDITEGGNETFFIRMINPTGETLAREDMGSGTLTTTDTKEKIRYTSSKDIEYSKTATQVCLNWDQAEALAKGVYQVEIYNKGYKCGEGSFKLK